MINPVEIQARPYYVHNDYVPVYYYVYELLEKWIANTVFREDRSRVFLASNEYAFRRRFELTDMSRSYRDLEVSSLHFPFANYWPLNTSWSAEERIAANPASLLYKGLYTSQSKLRASNANLTIPVTFYFDREDDARLAYSTLYFYTFNEFNYTTTVTYQNEEIGLPIVLSIKSLEFNPSYKESDWLKQNRIFIVSASLNLRTYTFAPPAQPLWSQLVDGSNILSNGDMYDNGSESYKLTHTVVTTVNSFDNLSEEDYNKLIYEGEVEDPEVLVNYLRVEDTTEETVRVSWEVENSDKLASIGVKKATDKDYLAVPVTATSFTFADLTTGSSYTVFIKFTLENGASKRLSLEIRTRDADPSDHATDPLIGISW